MKLLKILLDMLRDNMIKNPIDDYNTCPRCKETKDLKMNLKYGQGPNIMDGITYTTKSRISIMGTRYYKRIYSCWTCGWEWETPWYDEE